MSSNIINNWDCLKVNSCLKFNIEYISFMIIIQSFYNGTNYILGVL